MRILLGFKVLNFLYSLIKSDDIPPEGKLDDVNNTEMRKANKRVIMWTQILFKLSGSMFLNRKNEEKSQCPACKANILKAGVSPSFDLQTVLSLLNSLSASLAPYRNQSIDLLCRGIYWFVYKGKLAVNGLKYRSSHPEVLLEKGALKICSKFTEEHPCRSVTSIKLLCKLKSHFGKNVPL